MPGVEDLFDDAADESDDGEDYEPNAAAADQAEEAADGEEGASPPGSPEGEGDDLEDSSGRQQAKQNSLRCCCKLLSAQLMPVKLQRGKLPRAAFCKLAALQPRDQGHRSS